MEVRFYRTKGLTCRISIGYKHILKRLLSGDFCYFTGIFKKNGGLRVGISNTLTVMTAKITFYPVLGKLFKKHCFFHNCLSLSKHYNKPYFSKVMLFKINFT